MRASPRLRCFEWVGLAVLVLTLAVAAQRPFPLPVPRPTNILPERVALADVVVMGKVTALADKRVPASGFPNQRGFKVAFKVASLKVTEILKGPKGLTRVRVGFLPDPDLVVGHEACFLLLQHPEQDFYVPAVHKLYGCPSASVFLDRKSPGFAEQLALVKRCARLLGDPAAGLKAKDKEDRLLTAAMLVIRYRSYPGDGPRPRAEPINAAESKLILEALRDADWHKQYPETWLTPSAVFNHLGPRTYNPSRKDADPQRWLKENAAQYRIERFVREKAKK